MRSQRPPLVITLVLALALMGSLATNLWLFQLGAQYYYELNQTRLDPLGLGAFEGQAIPEDTASPSVLVFFGDSRAAEWPAPDLAGVQVINRSIGGQTTAQALGRFATHVAPLHPRLIVIQVGINDLKTIPLFPDRRNQLVATCLKNITEIVRQARQTGALVVLTTIIPAGEPSLTRRLYWSDDVAPAVAEVNMALRALEGPDVVVLDAATLLGNEQGQLRDEYRRDTLHMTPKGYTVLNAALAEILQGWEVEHMSAR